MLASLVERTVPAGVDRVVVLGGTLALSSLPFEAVYVVDRDTRVCEQAKAAGARDVQRLDVSWQTFDVLAGWCAHVGAQAIVADRAVLARMLGHRSYPPRPASFATMWARWWTESVQSAGVTYLWTEGADGLAGWSLATVVDEVGVLERVGWHSEVVDGPDAFLVAAD